jgi:glyoxylase-like metal-dependent hydrolase (beta-lactamase superfamily II)
LYGWTAFDPARNLDFHSVLWVPGGGAGERSASRGGNVAVDPLPLSEHDRAHLQELGGVGTIVVTNSDHVRGAAALARATGARVLGPAAERASFPLPCDGWLDDGDQVAPGLTALALHGSKTPGELALLLEGRTLISGDLIRAHVAGALCLLPDAKLADRAQAVASVQRLAALDVDAVLTGDGWPVFRGGGDALRELAAQLAPAPRA